MPLLSIHLCGAAHTATHRQAQQKTDGTKQDNYIRKHVSRTVLSLCTLLYIYTSWVEVNHINQLNFGKVNDFIRNNQQISGKKYNQ